jgi:hypothetical protein
MLKSLTKAPPFRDGFAGNSCGFQVRSDADNRVHLRRLADTLSARQWLAEDAPVADVLTMLEVRRRFEFSPHDCRTYAIEILSAARAEIHNVNQPQTAHRKEPTNAIA